MMSESNYMILTMKIFSGAVRFSRKCISFGGNNEASTMLEFQPKFDKILELLLYLAHRKPGADKYQAVKFFYLADKMHIERFGRPITFDKYYALKYGPVASTVKDLLERNAFTLQKSGVKSLPFDIADRDGLSPDHRQILVIGKPHREVDFDVFSKSDIAIFDEVIAKYGDCSFDELYRLTHRHNAYRNAWSNRGSSKRQLMDYADMVEEPGKRESLLADIGPLAARM